MFIDPTTGVARKLRAIEKHFGMDKLTDEQLFKIAAHKLPRGYRQTERLVAVLTIYNHKLPIPVSRTEDDDDSRDNEREQD